jgi:hypothetical protein
MDIRDKARAYLLQVPPAPGEVRSIGATAPLFFQLTGMTQASLQANWNAGGIMTSCNSFVSNFGSHLGSTKSLGCFNLDKVCAQRNKGYAWIPATDGARPKYGDIFEIASRLHQGISLDCGQSWDTAEGGQGGKTTGYDIVKRKVSVQGTGALMHLTMDKNGKPFMEPVKGWVDIELYFNGPVTQLPIPDWLPGWWSVPWRGQIFYYYFQPDQVAWTFQKPFSDFVTPWKFDDTGVVAFDSTQTLTIKWQATGSVEKFKSSSADNNQMAGDWNTAEPLTAKRCFYRPPSL